MAADRRPVADPALSAVHVLGGLVWFVFGLGVVVAAIVEVQGTTGSSQGLLLMILGLFFVAVVAAAAGRGGRLPHPAQRPSRPGRRHVPVGGRIRSAHLG